MWWRDRALVAAEGAVFADVGFRLRGDLRNEVCEVGLWAVWLDVVSFGQGSGQTLDGPGAEGGQLFDGTARLMLVGSLPSPRSG